MRPRTRSALVSGLAAAAACLLVVLCAAQPAGADTTRRIVSGWLPYWTMPAALATATADGDLWRDASPFWYQATSATAIQAHAGAGDPTVVAPLRAEGIRVVPTVTETLDAAAMSTLLASPSQRAAHVNALVALVTDGGYDGIDLDYESMNYGGTAAQKATVAKHFVTLAQELGAALDDAGKILSITVGPRTATTNWWPVHDYAGLGKVADRFRIMAYDYSYPGGTPGAIAPLPWVRQVVQYAVGVVPANRIQLGVPLYAYDWPKDAAAADGWGTATSLTYNGAEALRASVGATRVWDATTATPHFSYTKDGVAHQVWYEDQQSTAEKTKLVGGYKLLGLVFWAVGSEDTRVWPSLRSYATQRSTALSVSAPATVTSGSAATVTGRLTKVSGGAGIAGASVTLQQKDAGTTAWRPVATAATTSTGAVSFRVTPTVGTRFRLTYAGTWTYLAATSTEAATQARWRVTAAFADPTVTHGTTATLRGTVGPARAGTAAVLQRLSGSTWTTLGSRTVASNGSYAFSFRPPTAGTYTYRVRVEATSLNAASATGSRVLRVS
jgi:spore germination protein YaaH